MSVEATKATSPSEQAPGAPSKKRICYYDMSVRPGTSGGTELPSGPAANVRGRTLDELGPVLSLCLELFEQHWANITFGPCIRGAIFELALSSKPQVFIHDGYVIVDLGSAGHLHLCVASKDGVSACARVAFFAGYTESHATEPVSFGIRFWNGGGQQLLSVFMTARGPAERDEFGIPAGLQADERAIEIWQRLRARYCVGDEPTQQALRVPAR
jgi:hypothetical protein